MPLGTFLSGHDCSAVERHVDEVMMDNSDPGPRFVGPPLVNGTRWFF
jgi:hypothetical protein